MKIVSLLHTQLCTLGTPGHLYFWQTRYKYKVVYDLQAWLFTGTAHGTQTTFHLTISIRFYRDDGVPVIKTPDFPATWLCLPRMKLSTTFWYAELCLQSHYTDIQKGFLKQWKQSNQVSDHTCVLVIYCCKISLSRVQWQFIIIDPILELMKPKSLVLTRVFFGLAVKCKFGCAS